MLRGTGESQELALRVTQQEALAKLLAAGLNGHDLASILDAAARSVAQVLAVPYVAVLELAPDGTELQLRAGIGWREGSVGQARGPPPASSAGDPCNPHARSWWRTGSPWAGLAAPSSPITASAPRRRW